MMLKPDQTQEVNPLEVTAGAERLRELVITYCTEHRHPARPTFTIHEAHTMSSLALKGSWEGTPPSGRPGCYALFSKHGNLLYIGKASNSKRIGDRLVRFRYKGSNWVEAPAFVIMVEVSEPFEAPSLEEFLIHELKPPENVHGIKRRIG